MSNPSDIVVPELKDGLKYHCFIAFSSKDEEVVYELVKYLRDECKFKVATFLDFGLGGVVLDDIENGVKKSRRAIVMMSESYKKSAYYDHETLLLIHNNSSHKRQLIIPVCLGLTEEEMKESRLGVYRYQYINYERNNENHKQKIAAAVAGPDVPLSVSLPCGNVSQGLVWSFYYGYIKLILPGMVARCRNSKWAKDETTRLIEKVFILIPDTGLCHDSITDCDPNITPEGNTESFKVRRGGISDREYKNSMYRIKGSNGEEYFALCEYATPVLSMYEMCNDGIAGLDEEEKLHQIRTFRSQLDQLLSHAMCQDIREGYVFKIIFFKADEKGRGNVSSMIIDCIKQMDEEKLGRLQDRDRTQVGERAED